ncbi:MAG TPA: hypothetical protein VGN70_11270 [Gammaproteobacteria bacterium]|jgi:hypothetical protein
MKRFWFGVLWFVVFYVAIYIVFVVAQSVSLMHGLPPNPSTQQAVDAATAYAESHATVLSMVRWGIFLVTLAAAAAGTYRGWLPGTRKPAA